MQTYLPPRSVFSEHPLIGLVLPFMAGIAAGEWAYSIFSGCCAFLFVASLAVAVGGYVLQVFRPLQFRTSRFNLAVVSISIGLMGMALLVNQRDKLQPSWPVGAQTFRGMIMETPRGSSKAHQVEVSLTGGQYDGWRVRLTLMRDTMALHTACSVPEVGNTLLFYTSIEPLRASGNPGDFDYAAWLRRHGISGTGFCAAGYWQLSETAASHLPLTVRLHRWRNAFVRRYAEYFQGRDLGVITAMTLGDKTHLDRDTREVYSQAGVSHVLALSGLHLSILFALWNSFLQPLFRCRRLLFIGASLVGVAVLWSFAALAGLPLSLVRATIMFTVMQMTGCFRGHSFSLNNLALAAFIILTVSPQALFDVGFQLSCLSVAGILLIVPRLPQPFLLRREAERQPYLVHRPLLRTLFLTGRYSRFPRTACCWFWQLVQVSFAAQVVTLPLVAYSFHTVAPYGLLANLLAVPLVFPLLGLSVVFLLLPFSQPFLAMFIGGLLRLLDGVLAAVVRLPGAALAYSPPLGAVVAFYLFVVFALAASRWRRPVYVYLAGILFAVAVALALLARSPWWVPRQVIVYNLHGTTAVHLVEDARRSYLWSPAPLRADSVLAPLRRNCWEPCGVAAPCLLGDSLVEPHLYAVDGLLAFGGCRLAILHRPLTGKLPVEPLNVDFLVLARGYGASLHAALRRYRPRVVVLDASLTDYYRRRFAGEVRNAGLELYDVRQKGALVVPLDDRRPF